MNAMQWIALAVAAPNEAGGLAGQVKFELPVFIAQAVGFLVLFAILWLFVFRRVGNVLDARQQGIADRLSEIERNQAEAAAAKEEMERQLAEAQSEANRRIQEAAAQAEARGGEIVAEAQQAAQAEIERGRETIEREKNEAILALRAEVADLTVEAARQLIGQTLNEEQGRQIVDDMIRQIADSE